MTARVNGLTDVVYCVVYNTGRTTRAPSKSSTRRAHWAASRQDAGRSSSVDVRSTHARWPRGRDTHWPRGGRGTHWPPGGHGTLTTRSRHELTTRWSRHGTLTTRWSRHADHEVAARTDHEVVAARWPRGRDTSGPPTCACSSATSSSTPTTANRAVRSAQRTCRLQGRI